MSRLGARARAVLGIVAAIVVAIVGVLLADSDSGRHDTTAASSPSTSLMRSPDAQRVVVDPDGSVTATRIERSAPASPTTASPATAPPATAAPRGVTPVPVPAAAWATLAEIDAGRWPGSANAPGTRGGDTWQNREGRLPRADAAGAAVGYREWDVNPKQRGQTRDAERIVTGSDASAWYTGDHYQSFVRMRP